MIDWTAVLIVTGVCVVMPVVIVAVTFKQKERAIDRKMDVLSKAIENGQEIDPALFADEKSSKSLKLRLINRATWGVVLSVVAIVMLACALFVNDDPEGSSLRRESGCCSLSLQGNAGSLLRSRLTR